MLELGTTTPSAEVSGSKFWELLDAAPGIALANDRDLPQSLFDDVLRRRRSRRRISKEPVSFSELSRLLIHSAGVQKVYHDPREGMLTFRPSPSCGAKHPIEILVLQTQDLKEAPAGLYAFDAINPRLISMPHSESANQTLLKLALMSAYPRFSELPPTILYFVSVWERTRLKYGARTFSHVMKDVGALIQTLYLVSTCLELAPCALGFRGDGQTEALLGLSSRESIVGGFAIGKNEEVPVCKR